MFNICDFVRQNIKIRSVEITNTKAYNINKKCISLLSLNNGDLLDIIDSTNPDNFDIIYRLSSKSFDTPSVIISNRIEGLNCMLSGINYTSGVEFENINHVSKYKYFLIVFYILVGQVFSDGNHRVCYNYLLSNKINEYKIEKIIGTIDSCRRYQQINWDNLHKFIQKLINNLVLIITQTNENIILEKIENLFI
jgi:hypothetical protein